MTRAYVDGRFDAFVAELQEACRIPSISATPGPALQEMADWLTDRLRGVLDEVRQLPAPGAAPVVAGRLEGTGPGTILWYSHYDVQPVEPLDAWSRDPFGAELVDGRLVARGVCDDKADLLARIHALEAWRATHGRPPCSIVWLSEGAEEVGSTGLADVLREHAELFAADGCWWESGAVPAAGDPPELAFGCRGLVYAELSLRRLARDQHSLYATVFRSATADLVRALATLTDADGRIAIDGVRERLAPLTDAERRAFAEIGPPSGAGAALPGRSPFLSEDPDELVARMAREPTANIAGVVAGHPGEGPKTVLPAQARAKVDFRIVPDLSPEELVALLRAHLDRRGFEDVEIDVTWAVPAAKSPLDFPFGRLLARAVQERFGSPPLRHPIAAGTGPMHHVIEGLGVPAVAAPGSARATSGVHGSDEHVLLDDYRDHVHFVLRVLELGAVPDTRIG